MCIYSGNDSNQASKMQNASGDVSTQTFKMQNVSGDGSTQASKMHNVSGDGSIQASKTLHLWPKNDLRYYKMSSITSSIAIGHGKLKSGQGGVVRLYV